ncbi:WD repeat-containing protein on Y chromosome [Operophtera brumata]|uniref:WD repeat-containing protein on Y chromosome n=1 Tax=Operophtera brumata TaxID=104452 RepID=A0A0L7KRN7_OPEBR|nr:WD repeat-containing protein on Y chromosome [Operophtera brumata]
MHLLHGLYRRDALGAQVQPRPLLLNSYRAHLRCISCMAYIDEMRLTLGGFHPWSLEVPRFPPDVNKVASSTTLKVWRSGEVSRYVPGQLEVDKLRDITDLELQTKTFGAPPPEPLLGNYFNLPKRPERQDKIQLDDSLETVSYFQLYFLTTR